MNKTTPVAEPARASGILKTAVVVMIVMIAAMALLVIFASVQRAREAHVERVVVQWATPTPSPAR